MTGSVSGVAVLDVDTTDPLPYGIPITPTATTARGQHHFFKLDRPMAKSKLGDALDFQADGAYVVLPPSLHASGSTYSWAISPFGNDLAELPDWILEAMRNTPSVPHGGSDLRALAKGVREGARNNSAALVAGKLLAEFGCHDWPMAWDLLVGWNMRNKPPLSERELAVVFDSICRRELGRRLKDAESDPNFQRLVEKISDLLARDASVSYRQVSRKLNGSRFKNFDLAFVLAGSAAGLSTLGELGVRGDEHGLAEASLTTTTGSIILKDRVCPDQEPSNHEYQDDDALMAHEVVEQAVGVSR